MSDNGCDDGYAPERMIFIATLVGMALVCVAVVCLLIVVRSNHREDQISRRAKYQACQSIDNEPSRIVCVNGWH